MARDISTAILSRISLFAVGFVLVEEGAGAKVLGSGVLVSIEGRRGILTAGHVAEKYKKLPEIGLVRFAAERRYKWMLNLGDTQTVILQSSDTFEESKDVLDLAFTQLPPDAASSIDALGGVFLNMERNKEKVESGAPPDGKHAEAMLGLVAEFSGQPFTDGGEIITPMRAILHTGHADAYDNGLMTVEAMDENLHELPKSFGGMSGGGLWRVYFIEDEKESRIVQTKLWGIVSWQIDGTKIACQGWDRIEQMLIPTVREQLKL